MAIDKKHLQDEDFVIQVKPHIDREGWTGDVTLSIMIGKDNPLNDTDFESMLNFTRQICATVPLMNTIKYSEMLLRKKLISTYPSKMSLISLIGLLSLNQMIMLYIFLLEKRILRIDNITE